VLGFAGFLWRMPDAFVRHLRRGAQLRTISPALHSTARSLDFDCAIAVERGILSYLVSAHMLSFVVNSTSLVVGLAAGSAIGATASGLVARTTGRARNGRRTLTLGPIGVPAGLNQPRPHQLVVPRLIGRRSTQSAEGSLT
jgi:hypothetical protein